MGGLASALIALGAIVIAACSLTITAVGLRRKTDADDTGRLERRVQELEGQVIEQKRELDDCNRARAEFQAQSFALLLELHQLKQKMGDA